MSNIQSKSYFEGWYLKHQNKENTVCFIPAIHSDKDGGASASIQVIWDNGSARFDFPWDKVIVNKKIFSIKIGDNHFSETGISLNININGFKIEGKISYGAFIPPKSDVMGPFRFLPMQCNHGLLSFSHTLGGTVSISGEKYDFSGGTGYIEKDWGTSFPDFYIWTQCNFFYKTDCSVMVSVANIPFAGLHFTGCICCILYKGKEIRLATYHGAKVVSLDKREVSIKQKDTVFKITLLKENPTPLFAPIKGAMTRTIHESLSCHVRYELFQNGAKVFDLISDRAGFEYVESESKK